MLIETLSTFPHMYDSVMGESMMKRAQEKGILEFRAHDLRDWTHDRHRTTDDDPYGGGAGLVMKCDPIFEAVEAILGKEFVEAKLAAAPPQGESQQRSSAAPQIVFLAPQGRPFDDAYADKLAAAVQLPQTAVETALEDLRARYAREDSGLCLLHLDTRWQLATKTEWADCVRRLLDARRSVPLGPAAMETLTVIAYNQPVSRAFIEQVRGVDSSSSVSSLLQKGLIEEAGRLDLPGHPVSFRTTDVFLRCFGLSSLADLPPVRGQNEGAEGEAVR